jgi:hypothetical protein
MSTAMMESRPLKAMGVKLHNRRVVGGLMADGSILWKFKRLEKTGVMVEKIRLSAEAMFAMIGIMAKFDLVVTEPMLKDADNQP